ncbi:MAG TPA: hypothetical protein PLT87_09345 [Spirochaetales bacterium]|nr:hypothetical protein [Spirochaetales bacterium]
MKTNWRKQTRYPQHRRALLLVLLAILVALPKAWSLSSDATSDIIVNNELDNLAASSATATLLRSEQGTIPTKIPMTYKLLADYEGGVKKVASTNLGTTIGRKPGFTLGRFVTISVGVFPLAYFCSGAVLSLVRIAGSSQDASVTTTERFIQLGVSAGLCLGVGVLDIFLPSDW